MAEMAAPAVLPEGEAAGWERYRRDAQRYFRWSVGLTARDHGGLALLRRHGTRLAGVFKGYQSTSRR
jgi:hypothetical protein